MAGVIRTTVTVAGLVQGVGFRYFTARTARSLGLRGTVSNLPAGSVRVIAEGPADAIATFITALREGPAGSRVDSLQTSTHSHEGALPPFTVIV